MHPFPLGLEIGSGFWGKKKPAAFPPGSGIIRIMYNWSHIDEEAMKQVDPEKYRLWRITQRINYGLEGEKLDEEEVKSAWPTIKDDIDPYMRRAFEFLLWGTIYSLPTNIPWRDKRRWIRK